MDKLYVLIEKIGSVVLLGITGGAAVRVMDGAGSINVLSIKETSKKVTIIRATSHVFNLLFK